MIQWLYPELDPLSRQVLGAYEKISELVELPFSILDVGCMCGFFKHHLEQRTRYSFRYMGLDRWPEAIQVAREFSPYGSFAVHDFLADELNDKFDYVAINNIQFGNDVPRVIIKAMSIATRSALFGMPKHCGDYYAAAKEIGFDAERYDCGESVVVKVRRHGT